MESLAIRRVDFVTIYSSDLAASKKFYVEALGFPLLREVLNQFFQINVAGVPICVDLNDGDPKQNNFGLEVDDLSSTAAVLRNKGLTLQSGRNSATKEEWVEVKDPDGNGVIFLTRKPTNVPNGAELANVSG